MVKDFPLKIISNLDLMFLRDLMVVRFIVIQVMSFLHIYFSPSLFIDVIVEWLIAIRGNNLTFKLLDFLPNQRIESPSRKELSLTFSYKNTSWDWMVFYWQIPIYLVDMVFSLKHTNTIMSQSYPLINMIHLNGEVLRHSLTGFNVGCC